MKKSLLLTFISAMLLGGAISASESFENSLASESFEESLTVYIGIANALKIKEISITYGNTTTTYKNIDNYKQRVIGDLGSFFDQDAITNFSDNEKQDYFDKLTSHINAIDNINFSNKKIQFKNGDYEDADKYKYILLKNLIIKKEDLFNINKDLFPDISQEDLNRESTKITTQLNHYLPNNSSNNNTTNTNTESSSISNITNSSTENSRTQNSQKEGETKSERKIKLVLENNINQENTPVNALPAWAQKILNDAFLEIHESSDDINAIEFKGFLETILKGIFNNKNFIYRQKQAINNLQNNEYIQYYLKIEHLCHAFIAVKKNCLIHLYQADTPPILKKEDYGKELLEKYGHTSNQDNNHEGNSDSFENKVTPEDEYVPDEDSESSGNRKAIDNNTESQKPNALSIGKVSIFATLFIALTGWAYFSGKFSSVTDYFKNKLGFAAQKIPTNIE